MNSTAPAPAQPAAGPLTPEHLNQLQEAKKRGKALQRAWRVNRFSAWSTGIFAGLTWMVLLVSLALGDVSVSAIGVAIGMAVVTYNEFRGGVMVKQLDERGAKLLGWNQVGFSLLIASYCGWSAWQALHSSGGALSSVTSSSAVSDMVGGDAEEFMQRMIAAAYAAIAAVVLIGQGLLALYYFGLGKKIQAYAKQTPAWVVEMQRKGVGV